MAGVKVDVFLKDISVWAPGLEDDDEALNKWAHGEIEILKEKVSPKLEYTDPLFRRRLSQISKMTVHVVHKLLEKTAFDKETKIVFVSLRGEIEREFTINQGLIEDNDIFPAGFSLSVFNTPVALATLAFKLQGGYSVIYPSKNDFIQGLKTALAPLLAGTEEEIVLVYADELVPDVYGDKVPADNTPLAFAALLSSKEGRFLADKIELSSGACTPSEFLKSLLK